MLCETQKKPRIGGDGPPKYKPRRTKKCGSGNNLYSLLLFLRHRCSNSCPLRLNFTLPYFLVSSFSLLLSAPSINECISTGLSCLLANHSPLFYALPHALFLCACPLLLCQFFSLLYTVAVTLVRSVVLRQYHL